MNAQTMTRELEAAGMTQAGIASAIGSSQGYVSDLSRGTKGKRIGFEIGQKLHALWLEKCGPTNEQQESV